MIQKNCNMGKIDDKIEAMTEETVGELIDAFEKLNRSLSESMPILENFNKVISQELAIKVTTKFFYYVEKYTNAIFVTRWYWRRKAENMAQAVREASNLLKEV